MNLSMSFIVFILVFVLSKPISNQVIHERVQFAIGPEEPIVREAEMDVIIVGRWPYLESDSVNPTNITNLAHCGGALYARNKVLTAASCVDSSDQIMIFHGVRQRFDTFNSRSGVRASKIVRHPEYDPETLENNLSVITLEEGLPNSSNESNVKYATFQTDELPVGAQGSMYGWATDIQRVNGIPFSGHLRNIHLTVKQFTETRILAVSSDNITCYQDDGFAITSGGQIAGIAYKPMDECQHFEKNGYTYYYNYYTKVLPYIDWIHSQ